MNKFLNISNNFTIFFLIYLFFYNNSFYSQCNSPCFCLQVDEIGEVYILWDTLNITNINLLKINIEGGEFPLLFELIKNNKIKNIKNLQIQFHNFVPNAKILREEIRSVLNQTHHLTYDYYFIWENWQLNETI